MKKFTIGFGFTIVIGLAACLTLSDATCFAQGKAQQAKPITTTPLITQTPTVPDRKTVEVWSPSTFQSKVETLMKRVDALEMENKELKGQVFTRKLLLTGLDKGVSDFKAKYENHTHRLQAHMAEPEQIKFEAPKRPFLIYLTLEDVKAKKGFFTGQPIEKQ